MEQWKIQFGLEVYPKEKGPKIKLAYETIHSYHACIVLRI